MSATSSDSSADDDWQKFAAAAVTVADITSGYSKAAAKGQEKITRKRRYDDESKETPDNRGLADDHVQGGEVDSGLDAVSLKVRAALDAVLEKGFGRMWADPSNVVTPPSKKDSPAADIDQSAAQDVQTDSWVAFFKAVKPGTPCVLEKPEEPAAPAPRRRVLLPQQQLTPEDDKQALKMAKAVAVDGKAIIAAASGQWLGRRKLKRRLPLEGTVVDPKVFVPYDVRTARLLGQPVPACPTC